LFRALIFSNHLLPSANPSAIFPSFVSSESHPEKKEGEKSEGEKTKDKKKEKRVNLRPAEEVQQEFSIREYDPVEDDAAFRNLDHLCSQGVSTKLVTEFLMKHQFEEIQPKGWCCVAEDLNGVIVGIARSYVYDIHVNGEIVTTSYVFLIRVHPHFRRKNLALWLMTQLFFHDHQEFDVDYMTSWVVVDNLSSLGLQDKIADRGATIHGMPKPDTLGAYRCLGAVLSEITASPKFELAAKHKAKMEREGFRFERLKEGHPDEEAALLERLHENSLFRPVDMIELVSHPLHQGTYAIVSSSSGKEEVLAVLTLWDSGAIRVSTIRDTDVRSDGALLAYNPWMADSPRGARAFNLLLRSLLNHLRRDRGAPFVFMFLPEEFEVNSLLAKSSRIDVLWQCRVWYVGRQNKVVKDKFASIFYDPRQCLI